MNPIKIKIAALLLSTSTLSFAQSVDEAKILFQKGDFTKAKEIFAKQLKLKPRDPLLNQYYAICMGELNYANYQFDESIIQLQKCIDNPKADPELKKKAEVRLIQSETAARLMRGVEKVQIIDSLVVDKGAFIQSYCLTPESGSVESYDRFFNKSTGGFSSVYQNQRKDKIYFAEKSNGYGYQLYTQNRLMDTWSEKVTLAENVNSTANENFPFVLSDGTTLYYASDGESSMGGYDIFVTRYNLANDTYLAPENVGMPFNSVYNDYLLAIDEQNNVGWFASDRYQSKDKVAIYIFIPNESKKVYENAPPEKLARLAQIRSIKESWIASANYKPLLAKVHNQNKPDTNKINTIGAFRLVINDNKIYHTWADFKNEAARAAFRESKQSAEQLLKVRNKLDGLRNEFASAVQNQREEISNAILSLEKNVEELQTKQKEMELKAVNLENQNLK